MLRLSLLASFCLVLPLMAAAEGEKAAGANEATSEAKKMQASNSGKAEEMPAGKSAKKAPKEKKEAKAKEAGKATTRPDGLVIEDLSAGSGKEAKLGSKISVFYKGTFKKDGKVFDTNYGQDAITFDLLEGRLIKGWTEGIPGMKVGGKRKLVVPYALAYGERGTPDGTIPGKSDLVFEVELKDVQ